MKKLSHKARVLLERVRAINKETREKVAVRDGEREAARELVDNGLCGFMGDYDHVVPYREQPKGDD